jgi:hypothetical protein
MPSAMRSCWCSHGCIVTVAHENPPVVGEVGDGGTPSDEDLGTSTLPLAEIAFKLCLRVSNVKKQRYCMRSSREGTTSERKR